MSAKPNLWIDYVEFVSLVSNPAVPSATFKVTKSADGTPEEDPDQLVISKRADDSNSDNDTLVDEVAFLVDELTSNSETDSTMPITTSNGDRERIEERPDDIHKQLIKKDRAKHGLTESPVADTADGDRTDVHKRSREGFTASFVSANMSDGTGTGTGVEKSQQQREHDLSDSPVADAIEDL